MISSHAIVDLEIWEGATFYQEFTWKIGDPAVPVDLTDMTGRMQARENIEDDEVVFDLDTESGGILILQPEEDGGYAISISSADTSGKCPTHEKRVLVYDLFLYSGGTSAGLQQKGKITINPAVTRMEQP